jgi:GNAT superfamily N-acetyltransferase
MSVVVTAAAPDDADQIAALHTASWRAAYRGILPDGFLDDAAPTNRLHVWRERMREPAATQIVLKAVQDEQLQAFACIFLDADPLCGALLDNLHVTPAATGGGLGSTLLRAAMAHVAAARPTAGLYLWVFAANARARRFYERHGGEPVEHKPVEVLPLLIVPSVRYAWSSATLQSLSSTRIDMQ